MKIDELSLMYLTFRNSRNSLYILTFLFSCLSRETELSFISHLKYIAVTDEKCALYKLNIK